MTRLRTLSAALAASAALGAGAAGATTIISGSNSIHVHQSPLGTVVTGSPASITRSPIPLHRPLLSHGHSRIVPEVATREDSGFAQFFLFFWPWNRGVEAEVEIAPEPAPIYRGHTIRAEPENRATDMMRTILRRMDR
ncbi:hypothetical protein [Pararhodobacter sp. CCB-MM2]|uniref:hypothetical protein n=1 Tax=Pararhodobacter sp. CCB-MM2 TaxID=1786003 RepID=UPI00082C9ED5|nr:hypothetical protein [Pararhodobacter sp. CCB-MM2]MCA2010779.1 hypothetical protein [Cereibacter sphaeroides]